MHRIGQGLALAMACAVLAGCWQSKLQLYGTQPPLTPFRAGPVTGIGPDKHVQHYALARSGDRYRLTITDKGDDFGEGFDLAFFALPGAPKTVLAYQAATLDQPVNDSALRYYGLLVLQKNGAAEIRPSCDKDALAAKASQTAEGKDGACTFKDRAALETSLLALWKSGKSPDYTYTLQ